MKVISFNDLRPVKGIPYSKSQLRRLEKAGQFPKRIQLTERCIAWLETDLDAWIKDKCENNRSVANDCLKSNC